MYTLQRNDAGVQLVVQVNDEQTNSPLNLSTATNLQFIFRRPDKFLNTVVATFFTDGTDGKLQYISQDSDFSIKGLWKFQASFRLSGNLKLTTWINLEVTPNLSDLT